MLSRSPASIRLATAILCVALLASCATPDGGGANSKPRTPPGPPEEITIYKLSGSATMQRGATLTPLRSGAQVREGQPIQLGPKSQMQLNIGKRALLDLGPHARLVVHKLSRSGDAGDRATWLRLERGYLRVVWSENQDGRSWPLELSFARWAAKVGPGEYFFDSARHNASACASRGELDLSGVPETVPATMSDSCVTLRAQTPPRQIALREADWDALRTRRTLDGTLKKAAAYEAALAIANLEQEMKSPVPSRKSATRSARAKTPAARNTPVRPTAPKLATVLPPAVSTPAPARAPAPPPPRRREIARAPSPAAHVSVPLPQTAPLPPVEVARPAPRFTPPAQPPPAEQEQEIAVIELPLTPPPAAAVRVSPPPPPQVAPEPQRAVVIETPAPPEPAPIPAEEAERFAPAPEQPAPAVLVLAMDAPVEEFAPSGNEVIVVTESQFTASPEVTEESPYVLPVPPVVVIDAPDAEATPQTGIELALAAPATEPAPVYESSPRAVAPVYESSAPRAAQLPPTALPAAVAPVPELPPLEYDVALAAPAASAAPAPSAQVFSELSAEPLDEPAPVPASLGSAEGNEWMVNVASYSTPEFAEQQKRELIARGFPATVRNETVRGRASYRLVIEGMPTEAAALTTVGELDARLGLQSAWVLRKR